MDLATAIGMKEKGDFSGALTVLKVLEAETDSTFDLANLISDEIGCQLSLGDLDGARANLQRLKALAKDVTIRGIYLFTSSCLADATGDYLKAVIGFREILNLAPSNPEEGDLRFLDDVQERLALSELRADQKEDAILSCTRALASVLSITAKSVFYCIRAQASFGLGRYEDCLADLQQAENLGFPSGWDFSARYHRGMALFHLRKFSNASTAFEQALDFMSESGLELNNVYGWIAQSYEKQGNFERANRYKMLAMR